MRKSVEVKLPVIPKVVADVIEVKGNEVLVTYLARKDALLDAGCEATKWIMNNEFDFVTAVVVGYTVEEKKYKVIIEADEGFMYLYKCSYIGGVFANVINHDLCADSDEYKLTEKEIKDYDERFWAFAEVVEEDL